MGPLRGVVFDLDDTLHPERLYVRSGFRAVATSVSVGGSPLAYEQTMWKAFEQDRSRVFDTLLERHVELRHLTVPDLVALYREHAPSISLAQETLDLLSWIRARNLSIAVISDGYHVSQAGKVRALELADLADVIVLTDQWGRSFWKPHVRAFEFVQDRLGLQGEDLVYVADNALKDFIAPNQLGWRTVQFIQPDQMHSDRTAPDERARANKEAHSIEELRDLLRMWT